MFFFKSEICLFIGTINAIVIFILFLINRQWRFLYSNFLCNIPLDMKQTNQSKHVWIPLTDNHDWLETLWSIVQLACHFKTQHVDRYVFKRPDFLYYRDRLINCDFLEFCGACLFSFFICCNNKSNLLSLRPCSINMCIREYWSCLIILSTLCFHSGSFKVILQKCLILISSVQTDLIFCSFIFWNIRSSENRNFKRLSIGQIFFRTSFLVARACHEMLSGLIFRILLKSKQRLHATKTGLTNSFSINNCSIFSSYLSEKISMSSFTMNILLFEQISNDLFRKSTIHLSVCSLNTINFQSCFCRIFCKKSAFSFVSKSFQSIQITNSIWLSVFCNNDLIVWSVNSDRL